MISVPLAAKVQLMNSLLRRLRHTCFPKPLYCVLAVGLACSCITGPKVSPELSEQIRLLAEWRDTCTQYAAWIAREHRTNTAVMRQTQQLYIKASAAANAYIEGLQFDIAAGGAGSPERFSDAAGMVQTNTANFLAYAQAVTEPAADGPKSRGAMLLALPILTGLVDLGMKLNSSMSAANQQQRELVIKALGEKKWQAFRELSE